MLASWIPLGSRFTAETWSRKHFSERFKASKFTLALRCLERVWNFTSSARIEPTMFANHRLIAVHAVAPKSWDVPSITCDLSQLKTFITTLTSIFPVIPSDVVVRLGGIQRELGSRSGEMSLSWIKPRKGWRFNDLENGYTWRPVVKTFITVITEQTICWCWIYVIIDKNKKDWEASNVLLESRREKKHERHKHTHR